ncbi:hypothetical protein SODALDRAFT_34577 [Sodiomyces alkalinus F11]|uniref:Uncharacterized protein n=1 Tax=Sodiomyces alkalinus (strain CBS 110278 / VKM F-3762 / F11) TaxID=1314773 RepID=A0A3N2Q926_SODAK|nr:hypothetical protein SODALDRAFT_34577 [Sodiomyces alkalinus F11]ROT43250.1 hypothetical protein SODALDRAFT_34577 [Sodiomyces alkalinus F11]
MGLDMMQRRIGLYPFEGPYWLGPGIIPFCVLFSGGRRGRVQGVVVALGGGGLQLHRTFFLFVVVFLLFLLHRMGKYPGLPTIYSTIVENWAICTRMVSPSHS